jgi:hypothetical protein
MRLKHDHELINSDLLPTDEKRQFFAVNLKPVPGAYFRCQPKKYSLKPIHLMLYVTLFDPASKKFVGRTCTTTPLRLTWEGDQYASTDKDANLLLVSSESMDRLNLTVDLVVHDPEDVIPYLSQGFLNLPLKECLDPMAPAQKRA